MQMRGVASLVVIGVVAAAIAVGMSPTALANGGGPQRSASVSLLRASVPSAPRAVNATGGNGRATVRWVAPLQTNGSPITAYLVWPYLGRTQFRAHEFHSKKTSAVITGLTNSRQYSFQVAARNAVGIGPKSSATSVVWVRAPAAAHWRPPSSVSISWNWQLTTPPPVPTDTGVKVFDIDGFDTSTATVAALHARGTKVVCYMDVGTLEPGRPDDNLIPTRDAGSSVQGFQSERWLNIADLNGLKAMILDRLSICKNKGFDAVEPDNVDGYTNSTGFPLTAQEQLTFNMFVANTAHNLGLSVGLKNDNDQTAQLQPYFDWALDEECNFYSECNTEDPFINANKAVFNAEYIDDGESTDQFCSADVAAHINGVLFDLNLDGATYQPCPGGW